MAKQHDNRRRPDPDDPKRKKPKGPPPPDDVEDIEEAEVIDDDVDIVDDDIEIVGEATPPPAKPATPAASPTKLGKAPAPTKLAKSTQPTKLAGRSPKPTMLGSDIDEDKPVAPPGKKGAGKPGVPNLSLDDDDVVDADVLDADVVEAEAASAKPRKPGPGDSVEIVDDELFAEEIPSRSGKKPVGPPADDDEIIEAESISGPGRKKPAATADDDILDADEVLEAEAVSGPGRKSNVAADVVDGDAALEAAEIASDSGQKAAKPADAVADEVLEADDVLDGADVISDHGTKPAAGPVDDDVFAAEEALEESSSKNLPAKKKSDLDFLADEQTLSDEIPGDRGGKEKDDDLERTAAFMPGDAEDKTEQFSVNDVFGDGESALDSGQHKPKDAGGDRPSGVDALAEALESGVDIGKGPKSDAKPTPPVSEDDIDFSSIQGSDSTVNLGATPPPSKVRKPADDDDDVLSEALAEAEAGAPSSKPGKKAAAADRDADDLITEEFADDEAPSSRGKKKSSRIVDDEEAIAAEDEEEPVSGKRGGAAVATKKPPRPKYMRRWIAGVFLGWLLLAGSLAGLWYFKPDLIEQGLTQIPPSPTDPNASVLGRLPELKKAHADLPGVMRARADAEDEVKKKTEALAKAAATEKSLRKNIDALKETEKLAFQLRDFLKKDDVAELPSAVEQLAKSKQLAEELLKGMTKVLVESKALDEKDKLDLDAFQKVVKDFSASRALLEGINKKLEAADIKEAGDKGVGILIAAKKAADKKLAGISKILANAKIDAKGPVNGVLKLKDLRNMLEADRNELEKSIQSAYKDMKAADPDLAGEPRKVLNSAVKALISRAQSPLAMPLSSAASALSGLATGTAKLIEGSFDNAALLAELGFYRAREPFISPPGKQLDTWTALVKDPKFNDPGKLASAIKEAAYILSKEAKASPAEKAKALLLTGMALRNQQKFAAARAALQKAVKEVAAVEDAELAKQAENALRELTDSTAYFLPRAERLQKSGDTDEALKIIGTGLKAIPADGRLLSLRGRIKLDSARPLGKKMPAETQSAIRADLDIARKDKLAAAEAYFILGQLDESLERWAKAEDNYRLAIKHHLGAPEQASRYRIALARLLLLHERPPSFPTEPAEKGKDAGARRDADSPSLALRANLALVLVGLHVDAIGDEKDKADPKEKKDKKDLPKKDGDKKKDDDKKAEPKEKKVEPEPKEEPAPKMIDDEPSPESIARLKESIALARELIKSDDPKTKGQGYMILGQAFAKQGQRTKGLQEYIKGLRLLVPGTPSIDLEEMVKEHPAFQVPDTLARPNAFLAERQFGQGLHHYWSKHYAKAEEHFKAAIGYFNQDARYFYFLGLARWHQRDARKSDAITFLEQGARLEAGNHPASSEVNASLERIQGNLRSMINSYRQKAELSSK